jgi:hypothetical protein
MPAQRLVLKKNLVAMGSTERVVTDIVCAIDQKQPPSAPDQEGALRKRLQEAFLTEKKASYLAAFNSSCFFREVNHHWNHGTNFKESRSSQSCKCAKTTKKHDLVDDRRRARSRNDSILHPMGHCPLHGRRRHPNSPETLFLRVPC